MILLIEPRSAGQPRVAHLLCLFLARCTPNDAVVAAEIGMCRAGFGVHAERVGLGADRCALLPGAPLDDPALFSRILHQVGSNRDVGIFGPRESYAAWLHDLSAICVVQEDGSVLVRKDRTGPAPLVLPAAGQEVAA